MNHDCAGTGIASFGPTSSSLLQRACGREPEAWRCLVKLYAPLVFLWGRRSNLNAHDAADLVQDTFLAVSTHLQQFRCDRPDDSFRGWLWTITRNKIRDFYRRQCDSVQAEGGTAAQEQLAQVPDVPDEIEARTTALGLVERLALDLIRAEFEERTWQAFWQATVDGRSAVDVAADLGMTKHAVRQAKYRVLHRLRQQIDGMEAGQTEGAGK
jgi:RNA polymerase sigma-70 factor (ECF subfamily)